MSKDKPKGIKGIRAKLARQKSIAATEVKRALMEASKALDRQTQEITALRRIIISERAQIIYYTEKYRSFIARECVELVAIGFLDLSEAQQEHYIKLSIKELNGEASIVPHDSEAAAVQTESAALGKKISLQ
jgi:predicted MarR family transcription regulator